MLRRNHEIGQSPSTPQSIICNGRSVDAQNHASYRTVYAPMMRKTTHRTVQSRTVHAPSRIYSPPPGLVSTVEWCRGPPAPHNSFGVKSPSWQTIDCSLLSHRRHCRVPAAPFLLRSSRKQVESPTSKTLSLRRPKGELTIGTAESNANDGRPGRRLVHHRLCKGSISRRPTQQSVTEISGVTRGNVSDAGRQAAMMDDV